MVDDPPLVAAAHAKAAGAVRVTTQMSKLTSPMNREKRCEKQRCFIRTPSLSVWPDVGQTRGEKDTFILVAKGAQQGGIPVAALFDHPVQGRIVDIDYPKALAI